MPLTRAHRAGAPGRATPGPPSPFRTMGPRPRAKAARHGPAGEGPWCRQRPWSAGPRHAACGGPVRAQAPGPIPKWATVPELRPPATVRPATAPGAGGGPNRPARVMRPAGGLFAPRPRGPSRGGPPAPSIGRPPRAGRRRPLVPAIASVGRPASCGLRGACSRPRPIPGRMGRASCPPRGGLRPHESVGGLGRRETLLEGREGGEKGLPLRSAGGPPVPASASARPRPIAPPPPDRPRCHAASARPAPRPPPRSARPPGPPVPGRSAAFGGPPPCGPSV